MKSEYNLSRNQYDLKHPYCLRNGTPVWIDYIYTVRDGKQINIPERIEEIRTAANHDELRCACGCGASITLCAPDRSSSVRQHFKIKRGQSGKNHIQETRKSQFSKVILKGWLDDKLCANDIQVQCPANMSADTDRKHEYSFISKERNVSVIYSRERINLSDEKVDVLSSCNETLKNVYIVDISNCGNNDQFPERLYPIQNKQGYCLMLDIDNYQYSQDRFYDGATMSAMFYAENERGLWKEVVFVSQGSLEDYTFSEDGDLLFKGELLSNLCTNAKQNFEKTVQERRNEQENQKRLEQERIEQQQIAKQQRDIKDLEDKIIFFGYQNLSRVDKSRADHFISSKRIEELNGVYKENIEKLSLVSEKEEEEELPQILYQPIERNDNPSISDTDESNSDTHKEWKEGLNPSQYRAAKQIDGQLLILAGAGSGKTKTLTHRICHMIESGIDPHNILAITFTNKAAKEMNNRIESMVGYGRKPKMCTFHSLGYEILREFGHLLGYRSHLGVCDDEDTKKRIKQVLTEMETLYDLSSGALSSDKLLLCELISYVSYCKNHCMSPDEAKENFSEEIVSHSDYFCKYKDEAYARYQENLKEDNQVDFDDLIYQAVLLLQNETVSEIMQSRYLYISVDEYQDTDHAQFEMVRLLTEKRKNVCVVGDDYQSIYGFRGADISNILSFQETYPDANVVTLGENYRSTGNIVDAASAVISHNVYQKHKDLFSMNEEGKPITISSFEDFHDEARYVVSKIKKGLVKGKSPDDYAVLYRNNASSRFIEDALLAENIPYIIYGGVSFYARKEIKDIVAYLRLIAGFEDTVALERVINIPKRGMGKKAIGDAMTYIRKNNGTMIAKLYSFSLQGKKSLEEFVLILNKFHNMANETDISLSQLIIEFIEDIDYNNYLLSESLKSGAKENDYESRLGNVEELPSKATEFEEDYRTEHPNASTIEVLEAFLENVSLYTDADRNRSDVPAVKLMTMHTSKGLEFRTVFLVACEDDINLRSFIPKTTEDIIEEERRLFYVAMTRAKKKLFVTYSERRLVYGCWKDREPLRFADEIPEKNAVRKEDGQDKSVTSGPDFLTRRLAKYPIRNRW